VVGFVADKILIADEQRITADLERLGDRIIDAALIRLRRDGRDSIARQNLDVARWRPATGLLEPT